MIIKIVVALCIIAAMLLVAILIFLYSTDRTAFSGYYDYCIYVNKETGEAFLYNHGHMEPLYGADGSPVVININVIQEE